MRGFGGALEAIGRQRFTGSPTRAREEFAAAVRELCQALEAMEVCAGNRVRTNAPFRPALQHILAGWREHYRVHLAPSSPPPTSPRSIGRGGSCRPGRRSLTFTETLLARLLSRTLRRRWIRRRSFTTRGLLEFVELNG